MAVMLSFRSVFVSQPFKTNRCAQRSKIDHMIFQLILEGKGGTLVYIEVDLRMQF